MAQNKKRFIVMVRNLEEDALYPEYVIAKSAQEAVDYIRSYKDDISDQMDIEDVWAEVKNWH